MATDSPDALRS